MATPFALAARRAAAYSYTSGLPAVATAAAAGTASYAAWKVTTTTTECDSAATTLQPPPSPPRPKIQTRAAAAPTVLLKTRMTAIGRFSYESQTDENPSQPAFFLALSGEKPLLIHEFSRIWQERVSSRHPRFHYSISKDDPGYFEPIENDHAKNHVTETVFPIVHRKDLMNRIEASLVQPIQVIRSLWEAQISSGPLGRSGAISKQKTNHILKNNPKQNKETLLLFRMHHSLGDGVSIVASVADLCDEAQELRDKVMKEIERRSRKLMSLGLLKRLAKYLQYLVWFCLGSIQSIWYQLSLSRTVNPFDEVRRRLGASAMSPPGRSISWCDAAPVSQVKELARSVGRHVTLNDVVVSCVSFAVAKQLKEHRKKFSNSVAQDSENSDSKSKQALMLPRHESINVAIPVHLGGGVLLPGKSIGNNIGAFIARIPGELDDESDVTTGGPNVCTTATERLTQVHESLYHIKRTPAALLSNMGAKFSALWLPTSVTQRLFQNSTAGAPVTISNGRGSETKIHLDGRTIESVAAFLPIPPGMPIGIVANTYAGTMSLSVTAERWAVPDADKFLGWMMEEYQRLLNESNHAKKK